MLNYPFLIKFITIGLTSLFMITGCAAGINVSSTASTITEGSSEDGGGLPGSPTTTFSPSGGGSGSAIVTSPGGLTVFVRTSATAFRGSDEGQNISISDPFLEAGINAVQQKVTQ